MNILYGLIPPDSCVISIMGKEVQFKSTHDAIAAGIGMVHQKFKLVPSFTIMQNISLGAEPVKRGIFVDERRVLGSVKEISERYGLDVDPHARITDCPVGVQQRVEILKAFYREADILILDEPTAVLSPQDGALSGLQPISSEWELRSADSLPASCSAGPTPWLCACRAGT